MTMTTAQRDVLAHIVVDPDAWYAHAVNHFGQDLADKHLAAKVARWAPECATEKARHGVAYKDRAAREVDAEASHTRQE